MNLEEWALARKRLFDTNVFRSVDIQAVPIGDAGDGVQQVRARVTVEEYPPWRFRYGFQADRNRDESSAKALESAPPELTCGGIAEIRNQNLFGRAITGGVATRVELDFQRVNTFLQTGQLLRLAAALGLVHLRLARARAAGYGHRCSSRRCAASASSSAGAGAAASRSPTAIASSGTTSTIPSPTPDDSSRSIRS